MQTRQGVVLAAALLVAGCSTTVPGSASPMGGAPGPTSTASTSTVPTSTVPSGGTRAAPSSGGNSSVDIALEQWRPSADNPDPSTAIKGIYIGKSERSGDRISYSDYSHVLHVQQSQRVAYDRFPPVGGPHDAQWADCQGIVYANAVRVENMVHTLEHGAVWIAYNPDTVTGADLDTLKGYVEGGDHITLTPYPDLTSPVALQSWAHQLLVDTVDDPRIEQFITALRQNQYVYPEIGARCDSPGFDIENPPPFDPTPPGPQDVQLDGTTG